MDWQQTGLRTWTGAEPGPARTMAKLLLVRLRDEGIVPADAPAQLLPAPRRSGPWSWSCTWAGGCAGSRATIGQCLFAARLDITALLYGEQEILPVKRW